MHIQFNKYYIKHGEIIFCSTWYPLNYLLLALLPRKYKNKVVILPKIESINSSTIFIVLSQPLSAIPTPIAAHELLKTLLVT